MQRLAATKSRSDKEQIIIDAFMNNCLEFFIGARLATDQLITFGIKKVTQILEDDGEPGTFTFDDFLELSDRLRTRRLTGHAARDAIHEAASHCGFALWNDFYRRVLLKDLNVGVDETTINKVINKLIPAYPEAKQYLIPVFKCQLSHDGEVAPHTKKIRGIKLIDPKLDGMRILAVIDKHAGTVAMFTRNGQTLDTMPEIQAALQALAERVPGSIVLDGELVSPKGFPHLMTLVKRKEPHPDTAIIRYAMFDIVPLADFQNAYCKKTQRERREVLAALQTGGFLVDRRLFVVPQIEVDLDTEEGRKTFAEYNRQAIDDGYEGIMIKNPDAPYEGKRSDAWLKKKPVIEVTLEVVALEKGKPDGKYAHTLGSLVCQGFDMGVEIKSNVDARSDEQRDELWADRENIIGMLVEVVADKLTLEEGATVYSLRFPRLKGFRGRVPGEKL
jgi:DNA ligase-1